MAGRRFNVPSITKALKPQKRPARTNRMRQSTKALALFHLAPTTSAMPTWPPFCPDEPTEAMRALRDPIGNFAPWRTW